MADGHTGHNGTEGSHRIVEDILANENPDSEEQELENPMRSSNPKSQGMYIHLDRPLSQRQSLYLI